MAWTQKPGKDVYYEDQALTRTVPTTDATEGAPLEDATSFTLVVQADSGETVTGGAVTGHVYDADVAAWIPCAELNQTLTTGARRSAYNYVVSGARKYTRVQFATSSVTVSGGTTVRVWLLVGR